MKRRVGSLSKQRRPRGWFGSLRSKNRDYLGNHLPLQPVIECESQEDVVGEEAEVGNGSNDVNDVGSGHALLSPYGNCISYLPRSVISLI